MKLKIIVFIFVVCGFIFSCSIKTKSGMFSDEGNVLKINGVIVERFDGLTDKQKEAILNGKYKTVILDNEYKKACYQEETGDIQSGEITITFYDIKKEENKKSCEKYLKSKVGHSLDVGLVIYSQDKTLLKVDKLTVVKKSDESVGLNFDLVKQPDLMNIYQEEINGKEITVTFTRTKVLNSYSHDFSQDGVVCCVFKNEKLTGEKLRYESMTAGYNFNLVELKKCTPQMCTTVYPSSTSNNFSINNTFGLSSDDVSLEFKTKTGRECVKGTKVSNEHITLTYTLNAGSPELSCEILTVE